MNYAPLAEFGRCTAVLRGSGTGRGTRSRGSQEIAPSQSAVRRVRCARFPNRLGPLVLGFFYWVLFLLVLEPDNVLRAHQSGYSIPIAHEAARIGGAAILGAAITPILMQLTARFPVTNSFKWRHATIHVVINSLLAAGLILLSCVLEGWFFYGQLVPSMSDIRVQMLANWTVLVFALFVLTAVGQLLLGNLLSNSETVQASESSYLTRIPIKTRGSLSFIDLAGIAWLESQGNYVALHGGPSVQLVRRSMTELETDLDPRFFVRIHRRLIVAVDRIKEMQSLPNGDAMLVLIDGTQLRMSRRYRDFVRKRWSAPNGLRLASSEPDI